MNEKKTEWAVCIGVPYGTSLWQVGDSSQQNGAYKMALTVAKRELMSRKQSKLMVGHQIEPHEIMLLVNYAWRRSFGNVTGNKRVIAERGWYRYNRNLLIFDALRDTMAEDQRNKEDVSMLPSRLLKHDLTDNYPEFDPVFLPPQVNNVKLNFTNGIGTHYLDSIIREEDKHTARERIKKERDHGKLLDNNLDK